MRLIDRLNARTLSRRVLFFLSLALLPIGLIAVYQTNVVISEAQELERRGMVSRTVEAASSEYGLIRRAIGAANALGVMAVELGTGSEACSATMRRFIGDGSRFVFAGFIDADGMIQCTSSDTPTDISGAQDWQEFVTAPRLTVSATEKGAVTGKSVLFVASPVFDEAGQFLGASSISIPHSLAETLLSNSIDGIDVALVSGTGKVLSASKGFGGRQRIEDLGIAPRTLNVPQSGMAMDIRDAQGENMLLALVELVEADLYVLGMWAENATQTSVPLFGKAAPVFPILMWIASLCVAYLAIDRLVLRPLREVRVAMTNFSVSDGRTDLLQLEDAPTEFSEIAASYNRMAARAVHDHADLENAVYEKELLLREVHHRVKNNLQLIASILNLQMRSVDAPEAKRILGRVLDRVMSLAAIHKALYSDNRVDLVQIDTLLPEIIASLLNVATERAGKLNRDLKIAPIELDPDQAVPLSLLVTEAVTNASKHVGAQAGEKPQLWVHVTEVRPRTVHVEIGNSLGPHGGLPQDAQEGSGLGNRLIRAFVSQLGGTSETEETETSFTLKVRFEKLDVSGN